jgi:hypothetical protein
MQPSTNDGPEDEDDDPPPLMEDDDSDDETNDASATDEQLGAQPERDAISFEIRISLSMSIFLNIPQLAPES